MRVLQWFMGEDMPLEKFLEDFAKEHKDIFDLEGEEHKHAYMNVYTGRFPHCRVRGTDQQSAVACLLRIVPLADFQTKFESKLEEFLKANGYSNEVR